MRIAILSDIHGNNYALEAVLRECKKNDIKKLLILGDVVGYYYHPEIVFKLLSEWQCEFIKGNHEIILENLYNDNNQLKKIGLKYGKGHIMALNNLSFTQINFLFSLNFNKDIIIDNLHFQMNHGTPWDYNYYLYPDSDTKLFEKCLEGKYDFVLIGHSHYMFSYKNNNKILINPGSVGQSRKKGGIANWAEIDTITKDFDLKSVSYSINELYDEIYKSEGLNSYSLKILTRNK